MYHLLLIMLLLGIIVIMFFYTILFMVVEMRAITVVLETGDREIVKLKQGSYVFKIRLVDLPYEFVEVYRCVANKCKCVYFDETDQYGVIVFEDNVEGLSTIVYKFIHNGRVFGEIHVVPIIIDTDSIIRKTTSLIETLLFAKRINSYRW